MDRSYVTIVLMLMIFANFLTYQAIMIQINDMKRRLNDIEFKLIKGECENDIKK